MKSYWKFAVVLLALSGFLLAVGYVWFGQRNERRSAPSALSPPPISPYKRSLAGSGVIEPQSQSIEIGSSTTGLVKNVAVHPGDKVTAGTVLIELDDRDLQSQLKIQRAVVAAAKADLTRIENLPRPEDVPVSEAIVREAEATVVARGLELKRISELVKENAATQQQLDQSQMEKDVADAELEKTRAQLSLLKAGAWEFEKQMARVAVDRAEAELNHVLTQLDLLKIVAPIDSEILQVNVRQGEYVGLASIKPVIILGQTAVMHVRIDVDESDIPLYREGIPGIARQRGGDRHNIPLSFVRVEPYVIPKVSLTGSNQERTDTRVLQLIYLIDDGAPQVFVGQQVDVFFDLSSNDSLSEESAVADEKSLPRIE